MIYQFLVSEFRKEYDHITKTNLNLLRKELMDLTKEHNEQDDDEMDSD